MLLCLTADQNLTGVQRTRSKFDQNRCSSDLINLIIYRSESVIDINFT